nr:site-specific DNA-methyltransferase [bacterium]
MWERIPCTMDTTAPGAWDGLFCLADLSCGVPDSLMALYEGRVQMVYLDPPYGTGQSFQFRQRVGADGWNGAREFQFSYPLYQDKWDSAEAYLAFLRPALEAARQLLSDQGCIYVHVDWRMCARVRLLLDEIFGADNFLNEIIWHYNTGGRSRTHYARKHDNILFYRKTRRHYFNPEGAGVPRGMDRRNHMRRDVDENGRVYFSIRTAGKVYRYYADELMYLDDVWEDIANLQQKDPERTGYDTQKPEALLSRMIRSSTRPGDLVCDLFAGSGTAATTAHKLGRKFLAIDRSPMSLQVVRNRLLASDVQCVMAGRYRQEDGAPLCREGACIKADAVHAKGDIWTVTLDDYVLPDAPNVPPPRTISLLPDLPMVAYWAIGRLENGVFTAYDYAIRTRHTPDLMLTLQMRGSPVAPDVLVADVTGRQTVYRLND